MKIEAPKAPRGILGRGCPPPRPLPSRLGVWGSVVSSSSGIRDEARLTKESMHYGVYGILENLIQALSRTMSVFKDFPDLENLEKKNSRTFKDMQEPRKYTEHTHMRVIQIFIV